MWARRGWRGRWAERLDSPVILSDFSRLVIDPNRGEDDPTLVMKLYDGTIIPANRHIGAAEVERRLDSAVPPLSRRLCAAGGAAAGYGDRGHAFLHPLPEGPRRRGPGMWGCCIRIWTSGCRGR